MAARWQNWMGNVHAAPDAIEAPRSTEEVASAVARAAARRQPVRVLGAGGAWSPLVPTAGLLLSTRELSAVRSVDRERCRITVETGAMLGDVVAVAARHGLSVKSPSMYLGLSVGGLIATGSHGTGRDAATFGDAVVGFELVTPSGDVIRQEEPGSELWRALVTNVGALGVLTAVTLQCEPTFNVLEVHQAVPAGDLPSLLPSVLDEYECVSVFWYPSARHALLKLGQRTTLPARTIRGRIAPTFAERSAKWMGPIVASIAARAPALAQPIAALVHMHIGGAAKVVEEPLFSHYQQVYPPVTSTELGIPIDAAPDAWRWLHERLAQYWRSGIRPVDMIAHARFTAASRALIASSAGRATCHLEVLSHAGNRHRDLFLPEFDAVLSGEFAGRPHWGKHLPRPGRIAECHGDELDTFLEIRRELDPEQRFLNPFLRDEVFGLARRARSAPGSGRALRAA